MKTAILYGLADLGKIGIPVVCAAVGWRQPHFMRPSSVNKATGARKEATEWHNIVVFNQNLVKIVEKYVQKGSRVAVEVKIKTRKWQDNDGRDRYTTEIVLDRFDGRISLEGKPGGGADRSEDSYGTTKSRRGAGGSQSKSELDDEIPF